MNTNSQSRPLICTYIGSMPPCRSNACLLLIRLHNMYNHGLTLVLDITSLVVPVLYVHVREYCICICIASPNFKRDRYIYICSHAYNPSQKSSALRFLLLLLTLLIEMLGLFCAKELGPEKLDDVVVCSFAISFVVVRSSARSAHTQGDIWQCINIMQCSF